ncbi:MAG TPA: aldehyde dehydrogenase family protein, partial [Propionibacteriaceae bacterium]|nr:aldehyde dehydrogenase family protein [Propionibacteriaceae bacterium]
MDAVTQVPKPANEPVLGYALGSPERATLEERLKELAAAEPVELTATIGDQTRMAGGPAFDVTMPSDHAHVLGRANSATEADAAAAIEAAMEVAPEWAAMSFDDRAAIFL